MSNPLAVTYQNATPEQMAATGRWVTDALSNYDMAQTQRNAAMAQAQLDENRKKLEKKKALGARGQLGSLAGSLVGSYFGQGALGGKLGGALSGGGNEEATGIGTSLGGSLFGSDTGSGLLSSYLSGKNKKYSMSGGPIA